MSRGRDYQIWSEGYHCNGDRLGAQFHGIFQGETFADVCKLWAKSLDDQKLFDETDLSFWECRLFDNEIDARKMYG